ncbi:ankyrin repeat and BTB/POZ domain-containing protein BTBD11-like isoform X2 [Asterias rubens]|uniref:ankyrin repeat and BTB/POZ domain-containing protein BTBD11-like isoform X2 n=1 Tax=Asterias rubens TaxID=7604 RepID=UPI00145561D5|nr:ankyrin repeat and BTB/POZ domain-containing protein BTBD11-like isoform X2 [Asterias rubens]
MAGLGNLSSAFERMQMDSPTSNESAGSSSTTSMSHSSNSRSNSSASRNSSVSRNSSTSRCSRANHSSVHDWDGTSGNHRGSIDTLNTSIHDDYECVERHDCLTELDKVPWGERHITRILQVERTRQIIKTVPYDVIQRVSYLLQRPLVRIAKEAQRLSVMYGKCTKNEIHTAIKLILSQPLAEVCLSSSLRALSLYQMSSECYQKSKKSRSELIFPVGRFYRWLVDTKISLRVHSHAAVYLAACMETLVLEIFCRACVDYERSDGELSMAVLEYGIANDMNLWGIMQPFEHLICGRNSSGVVTLSSSSTTISTLSSSTLSSSSCSRGSEHSRGKSSCRGCEIKTNGSLQEISKAVEQSLLATCVGSIAELGDLVCRAMHYQQGRQKIPSNLNGRQSTTWSPSALHTLYYFMRCSQLEYSDNPNVDPPMIQLNPERPYTVLPPLIEWIRVSTTHCEHRLSCIVDSDNVRQAARLLLPGIDCPVRPLSTDEVLCSSRHLNAHQSALRFQQDLGFKMLACGRADLVSEAVLLLGKDGINSISEQGLTALMFACSRGDEAMVQILIKNGADVDQSVPSQHTTYPYIHPAIRHWTALSFAVINGNVSVVQLLLGAGANVHGSVDISGDNYTETPLQLASSAGNYEIVSLLLSKGGDPYLTTVHRNGITTKGHNNSFALAAANGHRNVLRKLLEQPRSVKSTDILSLEEILAEGNEPEPMVPKMPKLRRSGSKSKITLALQEAMYHSCEHGYLDMSMELRSLGVPWTLHCWTESLSTAKQLHRLAIIQCLLRDFGSIRLEEYNEEFVEEGLTLMFDILRQCRNDVISQQLSSIFSSLFGDDPIPGIRVVNTPPSARIGSHYVNNQEMSDVIFMVEGKPFYAHKIVLVTASKRFKAMLSDKFTEGNQPCIEISDFSYNIFKLVMQYLYFGSSEGLKVEPVEVLELLAASSFFMVEPLQQYCEMLCSRMLNIETATIIYKHAKLYSSEVLQEYCHSYFLANFPELFTKNESFRQHMFPSKASSQDLLASLQDTLAHRLYMRFQKTTTV